MAQRILRPLTFAELVDEVFDLYKKNFVLFVGIAVLVVIPITLLGYYTLTPVSHHTGAQLHTPIPRLPSQDVQHTPMGLMCYFLLSIPFDCIMVGAMTQAVSARYFGRRTNIIECYKAVLPRLLTLICTSLLEMLVFIVAACCCCLPIIPAVLFLAFVTQVVVMEGYSGVNAIKRSVALTRFDWRKVCGVPVLMYVLATAVYLSILSCINYFGGYSQWFTAHAHNRMPSAISSVLQALITPFTAPLSIIAIVLVYYDIRIRREGFDLEQLTQAIGDTPSTE